MDDGNAAYSVRHVFPHGYAEQSRVPFSSSLYNYEAFPDPGYRFCGWFSDGKLVPGEQSFRSDRAEMRCAVPEFLPEYPVRFVIGGGPSEYVLHQIADGPCEIEKSEVTVMDIATKKKVAAVFRCEKPSGGIRLDPGEYKVRARITTKNGYVYTTVEKIVTDGCKTARFAVQNPSGEVYSEGPVRVFGDVMEIQMTQNWYYKYRYTPIRRYYSRMEMIELGPYLALDDPVVLAAAHALNAVSEGLGRRGTAETVFRFVQGIRTRSDYITTGCQDYFKFPPETLWDGAGDCECKTILLISLMKICGFETVFHHGFVGMEPHIAAGVRLDGCKGIAHTVDGVRYVFCEPTLCTGKIKGIGEYPKGFRITGSHKV